MAAIVMACAGAAMADPRILSPKDGEVIHDNSGQVAVIVVDVPPGARLQPVLDGEPLGEPAARAAFELHDIARGMHELSVIVLDDRGRELGRTPAVGFQVWHASRLHRRGES
ncbi:MAG TPA: hypothetical protein VGQ91_04110 [Ideonella sp.]|jgi:hypothetical protein|nr:hypothetical protein [Ideonella sp.]